MTADVEFRRLVGRLRLRHLELLDALGRDPNVGRCARRLNMTQPTASKLLREIEDIFGAALFERNRRGLSPTPAGVAMTRRATLLLAETAAAHAELLATRQGATGRLRLGVFPVAIPEFLPAFCRELDTLWPGLTLALEEGIEDKLLAELKAGQLDCVFGRVVPESLTPDLHHELLYREPTAIVCGAAHPIRRAGAARLAALLADCHWTLPASQGAVYNLVAARLALLGVPPPRVVYETSSVFVTLEMLRHTQLLAVLPLRVARHYARAGQVARVPLTDIESSYAVGMVYRRDGGRNVLVQAVLSAARRAATQVGLGTA
ncbi:MAG: LysR family transcriptional regulator [Pigmentiphaga sp.]|nr:LysR family transcriptional regulator [Pigmentiphaga sp.]